MDTRIRKGFAAVLVASGVLMAASALADSASKTTNSSAGWGPEGPYAALFNPRSVENVAGEVERVATAIPMKGMSPGAQLVVKTDKGRVSVHLGPIWYLAHQDVVFRPKDKIEIRGSRVVHAGRDVVIAVEARRGDTKLTLRTDKGFPLWIASKRPSGC